MKKREFYYRIEWKKLEIGDLSFKGIPFTKDFSFEQMLNLQNDTSRDESFPLCFPIY